MRRIYFHIDEVARDAVVAANLKALMRERHVQVVYGNRHLSSLLPGFGVRRGFDLFIFPNVDFFRAYVPDLGRFSAPVIILPAESIGGAGSKPDGKFVGSDPAACKPWLERVAAFCLWSPKRLEVVRERFPEIQSRCHLVGHPRYDRRCLPAPTPTPASGRIRVGLVSRFSTLNAFDGRNMLEVVMSTRGEAYRRIQLAEGRDFEDRLYTQTMDLRILLDVMRNLDPSRFEIILKVHPRENRSTWRVLVDANGLPVRLAPWDMPFLHWLAQVDHVVSPPSTSLYDCFVAGLLPICTNHLVSHRREHLIAGTDDENPILEFVRKPTSLDELIGYLSEKPRRDGLEIGGDLARLLKSQTNYPECMNSLDAVAGVCEHLLNTAGPERRFSFLDRMASGILSNVDTGLKAARKALLGRAPEQSSSFLLTPARKSFIDRLAHDE